MTIESKQEYQWNSNWGNSLDIDKVVEELKDIQEEKGEIVPEFVVEAAKNKNSALHNYFEWNNKEAAHKYRLQQASELLRRIEVRVIKDGEPKVFRAFEVVSKTESHASNYNYYDTVNQSQIAKSVVINDLKRSINRLSPFNEYVGIVRLLDSALELLSKESTETKNEVMAVLTAVS
jgi:hypothetical protein